MKYILLLGLSLISCLVYAQDVTKIKEIGLTTANFNDFGITYRFGKEKALWRFNAISTSLGRNNSSDDNSNSTRTNIGFEVLAGKEWRTAVNEKLDLRYGLDLGFFYDYSKSESYDKATPDQVGKTIRNTYGARMNAVLGFNFNFTEGFLLGGEIQPGFYYRTAKYENFAPGNQEPSTINEDYLGFSVNSSILRLSLLYRF